MSKAAKITDARLANAVQQFSRLLVDHFPVLRSILFGSRARGDQGPHSDADIAVLLRGVRGDFLETKLKMVDVAYDVLLETGIHIHPLPIWEGEWEHPETHANPRLVQNIQREGIPL